MTTFQEPYHDPRGSMWHRWDLHLHTPASYDYASGSVTEQCIVDRLIHEGIRVVAITDHHTMDISGICALQKLGKDRLTVLPGIELRDDRGGSPIHYIAIFPENSNVEHIWARIRGTFNLTLEGIREQGGDDKVYVPIEAGAKLARQLGGVISIHAGSKTNSIENIKNAEQFQQKIKADITGKWVDLMEIGQIKDVDVHLHKIFPATSISKPLVICSDCHNIHDYSTKAPLWLRADPCFRGLRMIMHEPRSRVYIGERPPSLARAEQNPTKYVKRIEFRRAAEAPATAQWFSGDIVFNPGLVAIIGNKGSGKSALADTLGLLGTTENAESFSFLTKDRFLHPINGFAKYFHASMEWYVGKPVSVCLADRTGDEEVERIKYLPQDYVEEVCNELVGSEVGSFEQELKSVIFSHVPTAQRLRHRKLDDLVDYLTGEKQRRIDTLIRELKTLSRKRASLESQATPAKRSELEEGTKQLKAELEAHDALKPPEVSNPATDPDMRVSSDLLNRIESLQTEQKGLKEEIRKAEADIRDAEIRRVSAAQLIEKLNNFVKEYQSFRAGLVDDAVALGLDADVLISLKIQLGAVETVMQDANSERRGRSSDIYSVDPPGYQEQLHEVELQIADYQAKLDAPNRKYQSYLSRLTEWQSKRDLLEGAEDIPNSLLGLEAALADFETLPEKISNLRKEQTDLAFEVFTEKVAQAEVYRTLYGPVQNFIDTHEIAKDRLRLEFRAELTNEGFSEQFIRLLAHNRRGSFFGIDEGQALVEKLVRRTRWEDPASVREFLDDVDQALHYDLRSEDKSPTQLQDQLVKGATADDVFSLLYGLEYIRPKYILRWDGKDLSMLSPGERGTLLLVFYLLIDKSDVPLIIDQPEGNLDNHTVAKVLVDCIREARQRRQVFIVTHNPNLAVVCDADQIVHAQIDIQNGSAITYTTGSLENPQISQLVTDVLEGTRPAFDLRSDKYDAVTYGSVYP